MLAIIPARKGSKGLPNKNIKNFCGKPLIAWTIETLLKSKKITNIFVSTDDSKVIKICEEYKIKIPFMRPASLAKDDSLAIDVYIHAVKKLNNLYKKKINNFLVALPTAPLRKVSDIDNAIKFFKSSKADSLISCKKIKFPVEWILCKKQNNRIERIFSDIEEKNNYNRQSYSSKYIPNGSIYIFKYLNLIKYNSYYSKNTFAYIMPEMRSVDIDTLDDFKYAEYLNDKHFN